MIVKADCTEPGPCGSEHEMSKRVRNVLCEAVQPDLVHTHTTYLSAGDDACDLAFELQPGPGLSAS